MAAAAAASSTGPTGAEGGGKGKGSWVKGKGKGKGKGVEGKGKGKGKGIKGKGKAAWSKCSLGSAPSSAPVPPQGTPGGFGRPNTPSKRPVRWVPSRCLGRSS